MESFSLKESFQSFSKWHGFSSITFSIVLAILISCYFARSSPRLWGKKSNTFRFFDLPPELREQIYSHLSEGVKISYPRIQATNQPSKAVSALKTSFSLATRPISYMMPAVLWRPAVTSWTSSVRAVRSFLARFNIYPFSDSILITIRRRHARTLFLRNRLLPVLNKLHPTRKGPALLGALQTSRRLHTELLTHLCRRRSFDLHINGRNYFMTPPWRLPAQASQHVRAVALTISATPALLPAFDPRVAPRDWPLRDRAFAALLAMPALARLSLEVHARGSQIWNPIWLWHYISQAFKPLARHTKAFTRISFHLKGWSPGENHMAVDPHRPGRWEWRCPQGHVVRLDCDDTMPIREFCRALYDDCAQCPPRD